jgi:uncharacterized membrane protein
MDSFKEINLIGITSWLVFECFLVWLAFQSVGGYSTKLKRNRKRRKNDNISKSNNVDV